MQIKQELEKVGVIMTGEIISQINVVVPLSGGKDSQACLKLALKDYDRNSVIALFCDTGFEHPLTYAHVKTLAKENNVNLITLSAGTVKDVCFKYKRFPGGGARHCTDELKIRPSKYFYKELAKINKGFEIWCGVRSEESADREKRYRFKTSDDLYAPDDFMPGKYPKYLAKQGVYFRLPVLDWSKSEIFDYLEGKENPLYAEGFDRVGCFPCLASGESHQMRAFHFDETGKKHFAIAEEISEVAGRPVLTSKKYFNQGPGCALCAI
jgi:3'-phosphoadenosine 5'-phosphosulfate sulfotransferase (PAPS reductase)/FAD synthetase